MVLPWFVSLAYWFLQAVWIAVGYLVVIAVVLVAILVILVVLLLILYVYALLDDIVGFKIKNLHLQRLPLPEVDVWPGWDRIPNLQPAGGETFQRVIMCDTNRFDDPFYPHVSIIYIIGITKHASFWRTFTIWRCSTVIGRREYVCHFNWFDPFPLLPDDPWDLYFEVIGFYSHNAIFIHAMFNRGLGLYSYLFVYDIRHKKWAEYNLWDLDIDYFHPMAILCLGRKMNHGTIDGWRIRFLAAHGALRLEFANFTIDLSASDPSSSAIIAEDYIEFPYTGQYRPSAANVVRAEQLFGLIQRSDTHNKVFVYHAKLNRFQAFQNFHRFADSVVALSNMHQRGISMYNGYDPMVLNDREVIEVNKRGRNIQRPLDYTQGHACLGESTHVTDGGRSIRIQEHSCFGDDDGPSISSSDRCRPGWSLAMNHPEAARGSKNEEFVMCSND